jgi:hypothetical protein
MLPLPIGVPIACKEGILIWWLEPPDPSGVPNWEAKEGGCRLVIRFR